MKIEPVNYENEESGKNSKKKPWLTPKRVFIGVLGLGALGFGFWAITRKSNKPGEDQGLNLEDGGAIDFNSATTNDAPAAKPKVFGKPSGTNVSNQPQVPSSDFPIKKGSRGEKVRQLQLVFMSKYPGVLKSADGVFGSQTEAALVSKGLPKEITESQFKVLTAVDPQSTADKLYNAAKKKDFKTALAALSEIKSTADYKAVNEKFKPKGLLGGSNTTIVTGLLLTFADQNQKDQLSVAFTSMGLDKKDGKWFVPEGVSGIERRAIITKQPTKVWRNAKNMVQVGSNTILGYEVQSGEGITVFDTIDGYRLYVVTAHIKYN